MGVTGDHGVRCQQCQLCPWPWGHRMLVIFTLWLLGQHLMDCHQAAVASVWWHSCTQVSCRDQLLWPCDQTPRPGPSHPTLLCLNNFTGPLHCPEQLSTGYTPAHGHHPGPGEWSTGPQPLPRAETLNTDWRAKYIIPVMMFYWFEMLYLMLMLGLPRSLFS